MKKFYSHEGVYKRGLAVGFDGIRDDTMTFEYYDEEFTFPTLIVYPIATNNGYFYTAPIKKLRALAEKN